MKLVEKHLVGKNHPCFAELDRLCFAAKNLYNAGLYAIRQHFFTTEQFLGYYQLQKQFQQSKQADYYALPTKVSQQILMVLCRNFQSFFRAIAAYNNNPQKFFARPRLPSYKHKTNGRNILVYTIQSLSKSLLRQNIIKLSQSAVSFPTKQQQIQQVRVVPRPHHIKIEVVYERAIQQTNVDERRIAGIDIGLDNLATVTSNQCDFSPILINGRPLKSINHFFNRLRSKLMSMLPVNRHNSKRIERLTHKRNCKVENYLHHASRYVVNLLLKHRMGTLVIGKNPCWKQEINIGSRNNQNFVSIPHAEFIKQLSYKAELVGIKVIIVEESYTSKCSFMDNEPIEQRKKYVGKRINRGLFRTATKKVINADVNGALNIIKKAFPKAFADGIQGIVVFPKRVTLLKANLVIN